MSTGYRLALAVLTATILIVGAACSCQEQVIRMESAGTLAGVETNLTISADGSVMYVEMTGLRAIALGGEYTKITREGHLAEGEVDYLPPPPPPPPPPLPTTPMYIWVLIACGFVIAILVVYAFRRKGKVMAFASLVLPFLAIVVWAAYLADFLIHSAIKMEVPIFIVVILANILGLYFGIRSLKAKQGRGIATLGIVLNSIMMLIYVAAMWLLPHR